MRGGPGARVRNTIDGPTISGVSRPLLDTPFKVLLAGGNAVRIVPGFVNLVEPEIGGLPISGDNNNPPPFLQWDSLKLDTEGRGYIAVEVQFDKTWNLQPHSVQVVQVAYIDSEDGSKPPPDTGGQVASGGAPSLANRRSRWPLAMFRQRSSGRLDVFQITEGDLQCRADPRDTAQTIARVFFW